MNLTSEEKFNQVVWWILQEIKKESLATPKDKCVYFEPQSSDDPNLSIIDQRRALKLLEKEGAFSVNREKFPLEMMKIGAELYNWKAIGYFLNIFQPKFDEIYEKFRKLNEEYELKYAQPIEIFTNEIIPDRTTTELQREMDKARKWEIERWERERLHREQMKQDRILRTPIDKYTHALDLIIERAEYAGDRNSFSIEFYDFNFEQMIGSRMLERFLNELQNNGCFEKYTRTNYAGGARFGFMKSNIKNLRKFREKKVDTKKEELLKLSPEIYGMGINLKVLANKCKMFWNKLIKKFTKQ